MTYYQDKDLTIRPMLPSDCQAFYESFAAHDWHKPLAQFQRYFQEQEQGVKRILVAAWQGEVAGYTTLLPQAPAGPFAGMGLSLIHISEPTRRCLALCKPFEKGLSENFTYLHPTQARAFGLAALSKLRRL